MKIDQQSDMVNASLHGVEGRGWRGGRVERGESRGKGREWKGEEREEGG